MCLLKNYLALHSKYGKDNQITFFIPLAFIRDGDKSMIQLEPENFLGVNLKAILKNLEDESTNNKGVLNGEIQSE